MSSDIRQAASPPGSARLDRDEAPPDARLDRRAPRAAVRRPWARWVLFALLPVALLIGLVVYAAGGRWVSVNDAYVDADKVGVSTDVSGIVQSVAVAENQPVTAGQVLFRLQDLPFRIALQKAEGQLGVVRDSLNAMKANYRDVQAQIAEGRDDVRYYATEAERQQALLQAHVASQSNADLAHRNLQAAQQKLASLQAQLAGVAANLNGDAAGPVEDNPRYREAAAQRDEAARELDHTVVRAPFAGVVTDVPALAPGRYLPASTTAFYLVATDHAWVMAEPKETQLAHVRAGQTARVKVDSYPGQVWTGVVASISPTSAQEFALLPAQNSSGNWVKVVQRIPVRIRVDTRDQTLPPLRAGMSVEVSVDTGHARGLPHFFSAPAKADAGGRP